MYHNKALLPAKRAGHNACVTLKPKPQKRTLLGSAQGVRRCIERQIWKQQKVKQYLFRTNAMTFQFIRRWAACLSRDQRQLIFILVRYRRSARLRASLAVMRFVSSRKLTPRALEAAAGDDRKVGTACTLGEDCSKTLIGCSWPDETGH